MQMDTAILNCFRSTPTARWLSCLRRHDRILGLRPFFVGVLGVSALPNPLVLLSLRFIAPSIPLSRPDTRDSYSDRALLDYGNSSLQMAPFMARNPLRSAARPYGPLSIRRVSTSTASLPPWLFAARISTYGVSYPMRIAYPFTCAVPHSPTHDSFSSGRCAFLYPS
ncbi:hypothetical protein B0H14DRAFT_406032 [Mycena olivaceomarginata]|nr:hypothetical protein B0H14DRAFT_406032 [Mycena olivaceomarginata]